MINQGQVNMGLKVLYTLDNDSNSFLSRSTDMLPVLVEQIPAPTEDHSSMRIGAISADIVINQVCESSPELFSSVDGQIVQIDKGIQPSDFNVYVKDICEQDEPFVSLGLLSKLRQASSSDKIYMIGRVCTNFASMLERSRSQLGSFSNNLSRDTLEVKVRFSKVMTRTSSRRSSIGNSSMCAPTKAKRTPSNTNLKRMVAGSNNQGPTRKKRDTNPMPAPKAVRTQSLPIWNNPGIPRNSIAHKIYMADRNKEQNQHPIESRAEKRLTYQVSSLQQDNSVSKFKVDDSISKRFDFMNKKTVGKKTTSKGKTTEKKQKKAASNISTNFSSEDVFNSNVETPETFEKENIPPADSNIEDLLMELGSSNEDWFNGLFQSPTKKTPNDVQNCNSIQIDIDRTSPIDTLSMPLVDLEPNSDGPIQVTTGEQLKKLAILPNIKRRKPEETISSAQQSNSQRTMNLMNEGDDAEDCEGSADLMVEDEDATSIMLQFSTSPSLVQDTSSSKSGDFQSNQVQKQQQNLDSDDDYDTKKRSTIMPSSPTAMFQYQLDETSTESEHDFSNTHIKLDQNSTPATHYGFSDEKGI